MNDLPRHYSYSDCISKANEYMQRSFVYATKEQETKSTLHNNVAFIYAQIAVKWFEFAKLTQSMGSISALERPFKTPMILGN